MSRPLLQIEGVNKQFGKTVALHDVSLDLRSGDVLALVGENGAGKSTLMKILSGATRPDGGNMTIRGASYAPRNPHDARSAGVAMIYQELNIAPHLSVEENILLGQESQYCGLLDRRSARRRVHAALERLGHSNMDVEMAAGKLSVGLQQVVEIARALASDASIIVFDEPTSSLSGQDVEKLFEIVRRLQQDGLAIIYISHFLEEIREVCDGYAVLKDGHLVGTGQLANADDVHLVSLMAGRAVEQMFPRIEHTIGQPILSLNRLSGRSTPREVSLKLHRGEILGIAGLVGAGRTELLRTIYALNESREGSVRVNHLHPAENPRARIQAGLGFVSEDRREEGLAQSSSVLDNMTLSSLSPYSRWGWLSLRKRSDAVRHWMRRLSIKTNSIDTVICTLSGGNQQKVALARVLHQNADVFLLDEPTRGIDVGTKAEVYRLIGELAAAGKAILFVSSHVPELLAVSDTVAVMSRGKLRDIRPVSEWTEAAVLACAMDLN